MKTNRKAPDPGALAPFLARERVVGLPRMEADGRIRKLLETICKRDLVAPKRKADELPRYYWDERRYRLEKSPDYAGLPPSAREEILRTLSRHSVVTSYYIEKGAISFCAKMALLAETLEEKALYLAMGYEEVTHLLEFEKYLDVDPEDPKYITPFIGTLNDLIQDADRVASFFVAQVLLEGMALNHYETLHAHCLDDSLKSTIDKVLSDEAAHHGSGLVLLNLAELSAEESANLVRIATQVAAMLTGQGKMLLEVIRSTAARHGSALDGAALDRIARDIELDQQMKARVARLGESLSKIRHPSLVRELLEIEAFRK